MQRGVEETNLECCLGTSCHGQLQAGWAMFPVLPDPPPDGYARREARTHAQTGAPKIDKAPFNEPSTDEGVHSIQINRGTGGSSERCQAPTATHDVGLARHKGIPYPGHTHRPCRFPVLVWLRVRVLVFVLVEEGWGCEEGHLKALQDVPVPPQPPNTVLTSPSTTPRNRGNTTRTHTRWELD
jgi:hypothetical protein